MSILVLVEHDEVGVAPATLVAVNAAKTLQQPLHVLVMGGDCSAIAQSLAVIDGVDRVLVAEQAAYQSQMPEVVAEQVAAVADGYSHILMGATSYGKAVIPRLAALLDVEPLTDVSAIFAPDRFQRPIYAGNALATYRNDAKIKLFTIRVSAFDAATAGDATAPIETLVGEFSTDLNQLVSESLAQSERPELTSARIVVSGGRGLGCAEDFELIYQLADKLGAAVGASRAAVDAGFVANDLQVGQTGKIVAPELYIAIGISGAIQHLAGMKESKVIVAINKDPDAPIFEVADYGLVADLFDVVPRWIAEK